MNKDWVLLNEYLPSGAFYVLLPLLPADSNFHLIIDKERKTMLGNYIYHPQKKNHTIRINHTLNPYAFLITLLHEMAHFYTFVTYRDRVAPHGAEWKRKFQELINPFLTKQIFPVDIITHLTTPRYQLKASSCTDAVLYKILKKYDTNKKISLPYIEQLPAGAYFKTNNGRVFKMIGKRRKNYKAQELSTRKYYIFNPLCEVLPLCI